MSTASIRLPWLRHAARKGSYVFALLLLAVAAGVMFALNPNFFRPAILNGNLRTYMPLMLLAAGQTVVVIAGGIDLSAGAIVSLVNVVMVMMLGVDPNGAQIITAIGLGLLTGVLAGLFNGVCVAYLRFQPIVTTFASSFVFGGLALFIMPSPGGSVPASLADLYRTNPLGIPLALWIGALVVAVWVLVRGTRWGRYVYAVGGQPLAAYITGVPVNPVRLSTYAISGLMAALAALALMLSTGTGDALIGNPLTLGSVVAVVLGGTRLSGGQGGVAGALIGVLVLGMIRSIISFANVPTWWQTLADSLIVVLALAGPGLLALLRRKN
jgi:ribose transport system permease protein